MNEPKPIADILGTAWAKLEQSIASITPAELEARRRDAEKAKAEAHEALVTSLVTQSNVPQRQWNQTDLDRDGQWGQAEKKILAKFGTGLLIALVGTRGAGKTQLGVEAIRVCVGRHKRARFCTAMEFFMEIKAAYGNKIRSEKDVLNEFGKISLLVIDEIGQRSENEWENRLLFELLNRRYNGMKDTLVISNQSTEEFNKSLGPSLISRMIETGGLIECTWPSYRKN